MIHFWVDYESRYGIISYLASRGQAIADLFRVRYYENLPECSSLSPQTHIFSALDQLLPNQLEMVGQVWDQLRTSGSGVRLLNDPRKVLCRYELLSRLHAAGINDYRVFRARDWDKVNRFPVFIREDRGHTGSLTGLLRNKKELHSSLRALRLRLRRLEDLLIVEFCDTSDPHGVFSKYSAFKIGNEIIPRHLSFSHHWMVKAETREVNADTALKEVEHLERDPHADWLRDVFSLAQVDYGRMDYGVLGERPQVWEINLNPTMSRRIDKNRPRHERERALLEKGRNLFHSRFRPVLKALDTEGEQSEVPISLDSRLKRACAAEVSRVRRRRRFRHWALHVYSDSWVGRLMRIIYSKISP
jgi:hypothetical protein